MDNAMLPRMLLIIMVLGLVLGFAAMVMAYQLGYKNVLISLIIALAALLSVGARALYRAPGLAEKRARMRPEPLASAVRHTTDLEERARVQAEYIAQQSKSLEILYDAAAGINVLHDLDELLSRFLGILQDLSGAKAGIVRLEEDGHMRLVTSRGFSEEFLKGQEMVPVAQCLCGEEISDGLLVQRDLQHCLARKGLTGLDLEHAVMLAVPIVYRDRRLGVYDLFIEDPVVIDRPDMRPLFASIGRHLGIAIEKARLENHARRLYIMEERTLLANELHDSLAQSLASLRFQVSMVEETVEQSRDRTGLKQIRTIKESLDLANNQLRELLAHFRTRMDERGLVPAIAQMVEKFQNQTGISVFFQNELTRTDLSPAMEVQVLHIVQEALTNVRKHSDAQYVRVLMRSTEDGDYSVLVEDDGQGISDEQINAAPGEHIGLTIMKERAQRMGGELHIESEPGEGTRVELTVSADRVRASAVPVESLGVRL